jgi:hypothetical protein
MSQPDEAPSQERTVHWDPTADEAMVVTAILALGSLTVALREGYGTDLDMMTALAAVDLTVGKIGGPEALPALCERLVAP